MFGIVSSPGFMVFVIFVLRHICRVLGHAWEATKRSPRDFFLKSNVLFKLTKLVEEIGYDSYNGAAAYLADRAQSFAFAFWFTICY